MQSSWPQRLPRGKKMWQNVATWHVATWQRNNTFGVGEFDTALQRNKIKKFSSLIKRGARFAHKLVAWALIAGIIWEVTMLLGWWGR